MGSRTSSVRKNLASCVLLASALAGCANTGPANERLERSSSALATNTSCAVGQDCELSIAFPRAVPEGQAVVLATGATKIGSGARLTGRGGLPGAVINGGTGLVTVEASAKIGSLWTVGHAFVGSQATVDGVLQAGQGAEVQAGATAPNTRGPDGTVQATDLSKVSWKVKFPANIIKDINLEPGQAEPVSTSSTLAAGRYGSVVVKSNATLRLKTGVYYFETLETHPDSKITVANATGTVLIYVRGSITHRGTIQVIGGAASDVLIGSFYQGQIIADSQLDATLVAPAAEVVLGQASNNTHDGMFYAKNLEVRGGARVSGKSISNTGPAIGGTTFTFNGGNTTAPPKPSATGLTYKQYQAQLNAYINQLYATGYDGPVIELPSHPDARAVPDPKDAALPPLGEAVTVPAAAPPARPKLKLVTQEDELVSQVAAQELKPAIAQAETQVDAIHPYLEAGPLGSPSTAEEPPKLCPLAQAPVLPPGWNDTPDNSAIPNVMQPWKFGDKPGWLATGSPPVFDAYWYAEGLLKAGWNGEGAEGQITAGFHVGGAVLNTKISIFDVDINTLGALKKNVNGDIGAYFGAGYTTSIVGIDLPEPFSFEFKAQEEGIAKTRKDLLDETRKLFPGNGLAFPIGPFTIAFNGGAQVKVPLSLNTDPTGPELTIAPMMRVFVTVFAGVDVGLFVGVEGEADLVRVDMPFTAKLKWVERRSPEQCGASADLKASFSSEWSTLNGKLSVVLGISNPTGIGPNPIEILREEIVSWKGFSTKLPDVTILDLKLPNIVKLPPSECQFGQATCFSDLSTPNWVASSFAANAPQTHTAVAPYGQANCPNQFVYSVPVPSGVSEVWLRNMFDPSTINTEAQCNDAITWVTVAQRSGMAWTPKYQYSIRGAWSAGVCRTQTVGDTGISATPDFPWAMVPAAGVDEVSVALASGTKCDAYPISITVDDNPF